MVLDFAADGFQPVISDEVRIAMIRSEKMGKQKATLVLANGQKMDLNQCLLSRYRIRWNRFLLLSRLSLRLI